MVDPIAKILVVDRLTKRVNEDKDVIDPNTNDDKQRHAIKNAHELNPEDNTVEEIGDRNTRHYGQDCHEREPGRECQNQQENVY